MPFFTPFLAKVLLGTSIAGTVASVVQSRDAAEDNKRAAAAERRRADVKAAKARLKTAREARIARAQIAQQAETTGGGSSTITAGTAVTQQEAGNISFLNQVQSLSSEASIFRQGAVNKQSRAGAYGAVSNLANFAITNSDQMSDLFKST